MPIISCHIFFFGSILSLLAGSLIWVGTKATKATGGGSPTFARDTLPKVVSLNTLKGCHKSSHCGSFEAEHFKTFKNRFLERFSFECRKVIDFAFATLQEWLKKFAPIFHPIRSKTKTNRDSHARVFPCFASATCNYFEF